jgi:chromosome segregation ATPase
MNVTQRVRENPMTWKDWVTAIGLVLTLSTVLVRGGQLVERQDAANAKLAELTSQLNQIRDALSAHDRAIEQQRGADRVHDEQINNLRRDVDVLRTMKPRADRT